MDKEKDAANRCSERRILCVNYIQLKEIMDWGMIILYLIRITMN